VWGVVLGVQAACQGGSTTIMRVLPKGGDKSVHEFWLLGLGSPVGHPLSQEGVVGWVAGGCCPSGNLLGGVIADEHEPTGPLAGAALSLLYIR
jgi:hypothetical protein